MATNGGGSDGAAKTHHVGAAALDGIDGGGGADHMRAILRRGVGDCHGLLTRGFSMGLQCHQLMRLLIGIGMVGPVGSVVTLGCDPQQGTHHSTSDDQVRKGRT